MKHVCEIGIGETPLYDNLLDFDWQATYIEMHPISLSRAAERYAKSENLQLINAAISDSDGFELLETGNSLDIDPWCALEKGNIDNDRYPVSSRYTPDRYGFLVYTISLGTLMAQIPSMDILSMDIQGSEFGVLKPTFPDGKFPRLINIEIHNVSKRPDLRRLLEYRGYEYIRTWSENNGRPNDLYEYQANPILSELSNQEKVILNV